MLHIAFTDVSETDTPLLYGGSRRQDYPYHPFWGPGIRMLYSLHYVERGRGILEMDGVRHPVKEGESFLIFPHTPVYYYPDSADPWEYTWVDFAGTQAASLVAQTGFTTAQPVAPSLPPEKVLPLFRAMTDAEGDPAPAAQVHTTGRLMILLAHYIRWFPSLFGEESGRPLLQRAIQLMAARYHQPVSIGEMAVELGISRVHLYRLFEQNLSLSPSAYLSRLRLQNARQLLTRSTLPIRDVARSVGFEDPLYFTKVFRQATGMTPSAYRRTHQLV